MLIQVLDAAGEPHYTTAQGQDQIDDFSGALAAGAIGGAATPQPIAPANANRAGWLFQNTSAQAMLLLEIATGGFWVINSGQFFPPCGYPIPVGAIAVQGSPTSLLGDPFTYREWVNGPTE